MAEREFKSLDFKERSGTPGTFSGWASRYHEKDSYGDVVMPGAYDRTVREHGGEIVILADHDATRSIGLALITLKSEGLWVDAKLSLELIDGRDAYIRMRDLKKSGLSIGFESRLDRFSKDGTRELLDIELFEVSSVQFPALGSARVHSVKDRGAADVADIAAGLKRLRAAIESANAEMRAERKADPVIERLEREFKALEAARAMWGDHHEATRAAVNRFAQHLEEAKVALSFSSLLKTVRETINTIRDAA